MRKRSLSAFAGICLAGILVAACGQANDTTQDPAASSPNIEPLQTSPVDTLSRTGIEPVRVVFLGDSLTAGYGLADGQAFPEKTILVLDEEGIDVDAINAGVSGDTTASARARFEFSIGMPPPDILVLAIGANDFLSGVDPARTRANLAAMIEAAQAKGVHVLLAGIGARSVGMDQREQSYAAIYPELAEIYGVALYPNLLDGLEASPQFLQSDGLHPNADGTTEMASRFAPFLRDEIESFTSAGERGPSAQ